MSGLQFILNSPFEKQDKKNPNKIKTLSIALQYFRKYDFKMIVLS